MKRGLTIRLKILLGFFALIMIFAGYGVYNIYIINNNGKSIKNTQEIIDPSFDVIKDFKLMVEGSQRLTIAWAFSSILPEDKDKLKEIQDMQYPKLKEKLQGLMKNWSDTTQAVKIDSVFKQFDKFVEIQKKDVMEQIVTEEDRVQKLLEMNNVAETEINPRAKSIIEKLDKIEDFKRTEKNKAQISIINSFESLKYQIIVLIGLVVLLGISIAFTLTNNIVQPINYINRVISQLGKGELPEDKKTKFRRDEIGQIATSVDNLINGLRSTSQFAESIGRGIYNAEYKPLSENDVLGNALIEMRDNLEKVDYEDRIRNWATEGLATFGDILRKNNDDINRLADVIISELVKKLNANQGGLFIVTKDEDGSEEYLKMEACYAWDKKKYLEQKVYLGDGLTGQAWQEQSTIYLTEVPNDYITITSGLGKTNPRSVLIVPLKVNDEVFGVVEIASISEIEDYQIRFVERVAESIASTIATVKNTEQTAKLLEESKMLTEQMKAQEEEMIQNMEELQATQEEMERSQIVALEKDALLNANNLIFYLSRKFTINSANELASQLLYYAPDEFEGLNMVEIFYSDAKFEEMKVNLSRGEYWSGLTTIKAKGGDELLVKISAGSLGIGMSNNRYIIIMDNINDIKLLQN
ncbi:MAG: GAF domain-containing protein [Raineya sp.]|jgi:putative methionine-R-sulfoxide reductase with GAF domain|nr:GAF domain-containing protein [Raineya sp.]